MNLQQLINTLLGAAPEVGKGVVRGVTADVVGAPVDTLNAVRQGLLAPAEAGNPYARQLGGLLGPVQQTGSSDYFAQQMGLPAGQGMAYEAGRMLSPSPADIVSAFRRAPSIQELITYHGTPHKFPATEANPLGEFDASKIGTGEGAQAYGHGVYLAEDPNVANQYRINLSYDPEKMKIGNRQINDVYDSIQNAAARMPIDKANAEYEKLELLENLMMNQSVSDVSSRAAAMSPETKKWFEKEVAPAFKTYGSFYTADLPDEMIDRMLDWDKEFSKQPESVKNAIKQSGLYKEYKENLSNFASPISTRNKTARGQNFLAYLEYKLGGESQASEYLKSLGIPGVKYLDQGSRDKGKGTRNFVVFPGEEKKVKILKRE